MQNNAKIEDYLSLTKKQQDYIRIKYETGKTDIAIAEEIDVNNATISRWKQTAEFTNGLKGFTAHHLDSTAPLAMKRMAELLYAKSELVSYQAAKDILDRTGYVPVDKKEVELTGGVVIVDDIPPES